MKPKIQEADYLQAWGETLACIPDFQEWKAEAAKRLARGESDESVLCWLTEHVGSVAGEEEHAAGFDRVVASWLLDWTKTGRPGPVFKEARGSVVVVQFPDGRGGSIPQVHAVAGPLSDPVQIAEEFLAKCREVLPKQTWVKKETPARDARWFRLHKEGMQDAEIDATSPAEDSWSGANTVRQARFQWRRYVRRITGPS
jgi:hypothetical protein